MLKTERLSFSYNSSHIFTFPDILLQQGEDLLILGDSGVGKTTLIQILSGLLSPQSGFVEVNGTRFQDLSSKSLLFCDKVRIGKHSNISSSFFIN